MGTHPTDGERGIEVEEFTQLLPAPPVQEPSEDRLRELRRSVMSEIRAQKPRRRRRGLLVALAAGALAAALFAGVSLSTESGSHRPGPGKTIYPSPAQSPTPYPTNAAGQTYGGAQRDAARADLWGVVATRGENGYVWPTDLEGPRAINADEIDWMNAFDKRREVPVYESDGVTQVGVFIDGGGAVRVESADGTVTEKEFSNEVAKQPPAWLFDQMKNLAGNAGDVNAWAWWTLTTAEKAAAATGNTTAEMTDPDRPVYVAFILGDFTKWLWSLPEGTSAPEYSWIYEVIDAGSHEPDGSGASAKQFETATGLDLNIVGLRDRVRM